MLFMERGGEEKIKKTGEKERREGGKQKKKKKKTELRPTSPCCSRLWNWVNAPRTTDATTVPLHRLRSLEPRATKPSARAEGSRAEADTSVGRTRRERK